MYIYPEEMVVKIDPTKTYYEVSFLDPDLPSVCGFGVGKYISTDEEHMQIYKRQKICFTEVGDDFRWESMMDL